MEKSWTVDVDDESMVMFRIVKFPGDFKFSMTYLLNIGQRCMGIARIDNYPHDGTRRTHIHRLNDSRVEYREISFEEAKETIIKIGNAIKERMKNDTF